MFRPQFGEAKKFIDQATIRGKEDQQNEAKRRKIELSERLRAIFRDEDSSGRFGDQSPTKSEKRRRQSRKIRRSILRHMEYPSVDDSLASSGNMNASGIIGDWTQTRQKSECITLGTSRREDHRFSSKKKIPSMEQGQNGRESKLELD